jgi:fatty acid desaturase
MQCLAMYRGFQEPQNRCLVRGVELPDMAAILALATGAGEGSTTAWEATFGVAPPFAIASATAFSSAAAFIHNLLHRSICGLPLRCNPRSYCQ